MVLRASRQIPVEPKIDLPSGVLGQFSYAEKEIMTIPLGTMD